LQLEINIFFQNLTLNQSSIEILTPSVTTNLTMHHCSHLVVVYRQASKISLFLKTCC